MYVYLLVVISNDLRIAIPISLFRGPIETVGICVISPFGIRSKTLSHLQSLLHEKPTELLESLGRHPRHSSGTPKRMSLSLELNGQVPVDLQGGPILPEYRSPTLEINDCDPREVGARDLLLEVLTKVVQM
jgi:hypothetical protein